MPLKLESGPSKDCAVAPVPRELSPFASTAVFLLKFKMCMGFGRRLLVLIPLRGVGGSLEPVGVGGAWRRAEMGEDLRAPEMGEERTRVATLGLLLWSDCMVFKEISKLPGRVGIAVVSIVTAAPRWRSCKRERGAAELAESRGEAGSVKDEVGERG